jgi:biopolymer transport protein ExbD
MEFDEFKNPIKEARQGRVRQNQGVMMDMNAMVDMAFLLLTFFMLTTTMVKPKVIELVMPVQDTQEEKTVTQAIKESRALTLIPLPEDKLAFYRGQSEARAELTAYGKNGIREILTNFVKEVDDGIVLVKPHPESAYEHLIDLLDELNISGLERYTIDKMNENDERILRESGIEWAAEYE